MTTKQKILNSIKPVIKESKKVFINKDNISVLAKKLLKVAIPPWDNELQYKGSEEDTIQYYFLLDSINFCFWAKKGEEKWKFDINNNFLLVN